MKIKHVPIKAREFIDKLLAEIDQTKTTTFTVSYGQIKNDSPKRFNIDFSEVFHEIKYNFQQYSYACCLGFFPADVSNEKDDIDTLSKLKQFFTTNNVKDSYEMFICVEQGVYPLENFKIEKNDDSNNYHITINYLTQTAIPNEQVVNSLNIKDIYPQYFEYFSWTEVQKNMLKLFLDFLDKGGEFNTFCDIKIMQSITCRDICLLRECKQNQINGSIKDETINKLLNVFGTSSQIVMYRGLSKEELEAIFKYTQMMNKNTRICKLASSKSFTPFKDVAEYIGKLYAGKSSKLITVFPTKSNKILYIDEIVFLSYLAEYLYDNNIEAFKNMCLDNSIDDDYHLLQGEHVVPKGTIFKIKDLKNLHFEV